ncbi:MAG: hypothetical protein WD273_05065 [Trueperaceae bacterium]
MRVTAGGDDELRSDYRSGAVNGQHLRVVADQDGVHLPFEVVSFLPGVLDGAG